MERWEAEETARMAPTIRKAQIEHDILDKRVAGLKEKAAKATDPGGQLQLRREAIDAGEELAHCLVPRTRNSWSTTSRPRRRSRS
jgi:hypothetical protein